MIKTPKMSEILREEFMEPLNVSRPGLYILKVGEATFKLRTKK